MGRINNSSIQSNRLYLGIALLIALSLHGCATLKGTSVKPPTPRGVPEGQIERNEFSVAKEDDVIGQLATIKVEKGDTLPDIARHFSLGISEISVANPGVDVWVPKSDERIVLPLSHILPDSPRKGIVINLASMRLFQFRQDSGAPAVATYPVGIGTTERPSPVGPMFVQRKTVRPTWVVPASIAEDHRKKGDILPAKVLPGPLNPLGEYALYLSKPGYLVHGTNKPYSIGLNATNGCIRLYPEDVRKLYESTPVNTPVRIVNQPYLIGQHNGLLYMEVHAAPGERDGAELENLFTRLKKLQKRVTLPVDWDKVRQTLAEARGVPVPISEIDQTKEKGVGDIIEVRHPDKLYGKPEVPETRTDGWYLSAGDLEEKTAATRLAAMINHQGPPIPARVLPKNTGYRVLAGPFTDANEARDAAKRLKFDLEIEGTLIEPAKDR